MRNATFLAATSLAFAAALPATGQDAPTSPAFSSWFQWDNATGDWGGARTRLEDRGIDFALNFTGDLLGNPEGGLDQATAFAYMAYGSVTLDFEKLGVVPGLSFYIAAAAPGGHDLSGDDIGNFFGVAQIFNGDEARLAEAYFEQTLAGGVIDFVIGRLATGNDFATADSFANYVNGGINGNLGGIPGNFPSFTASPFAQWGARLTVTPSDLFYISAGVYNADPDVQNESNNGFDFTLNPDDGVLTLVEIGLTPNQSDTASGLPGRYVIGGVFDSSDYETFDDSDDTKSGNYGFYAIAEQMVYRDGGPGSSQGLTLWAGITSVPDEEINTLPFGFYGGGYYTGLFNARPDDITAAAVYYGEFSDDLDGQNSETVLEINHRFQIAPSTYITPDFQYIFNPNGGGIPDAWVIGLEASIDF